MTNTANYKTFPLNELVISPVNVRVVNPSKKADKELIAGIKSLGVLQNLIVDITDNGMGDVIAGGRRLAALQYLESVGDIPNDYPLLCRVRQAGEDITEISLAENTQRAAMHPADEYVAFAKLRSDGFSIDEIATKFGLSKKDIARNLALGNVATDLINHYRNGKIDLDCLMAFTVVPDEKRQMACYKELSRGGRLNSGHIKNWLVGESYSIDKGLGKFVGNAAYTKAGGSSSSDLFGDKVYLAESELVIELANKKLEKEVEAVRAEGWSWVTFSIRNETDGMVRLQPELTGVPKRMVEKLAALETEFAEVTELCREQGWPDDLDQRYDELEESIEKFEESRDQKYLKFNKKQMAYSGAMLSVNYHGELSIERGLAHKKDVPQPKSRPADENAATNTGSDSEDSQKGISQSLSDDLRAYRQQITQAALLSDPAAATDVLYYSMACQMLGDRFDSGSMVSSRFDTVEATTSRNDTDEGRAFDEISLAASGLNTEWLAIEDKGERFAAFRNLKVEDKSQIVTYCVARSLRIDSKGTNGAAEMLIGQLGVDFSEYWRPTADNYLKRISITQLQEVFMEVSNDEYHDCHKDKTKGAVVINVKKLLDDHANGKKWLPEQF